MKYALLYVFLLLFLFNHREAKSQRKKSEFYYQKGVIYYNEEKHDEALYCFKKAINKKWFTRKEDSLMYYHAALLAQRANETNNAIKYFRKCCKIDYQKHKSLQEIANLYNKTGNKKKYLATLKKGIKEYPDSNIAFIVPLINKAIKEEKKNQAIALLKNGMQQNPNNSSFPETIGFLYHSSEELSDSALLYYHKALAIDPNNFNCLFNAGVLFYNKRISDNQMQTIEQTNQNKNTDLFIRAVIYFENCFRLDTANLEVTQILQTLYFHLEMHNKMSILKKNPEELLQLIGRELTFDYKEHTINTTDIFPEIVLEIPNVGNGSKIVVKQPVSLIKGKATDPNGISYIFVNGFSIPFDKNGIFSYSFELEKGNNIIEIEAINTKEKSKHLKFMIYYLSE